MRRHLSLLASSLLVVGSFLAILTVVPQSVRAAIAVDNTTTNVDSVGRSSASFSHAIGGTDRLLVVFIQAGDLQGDNAEAVTYNGTSLTFAVEMTETSRGTRTAEIWYLVNPPTGTHTVSVTYSGTLSHDCVGAVSFTGVDQTTPVGANGTDDGILSILQVDVTTQTANSWVVAGGLMRGDDSDPFSPGAGDVELYDTSSGGGAGGADSGCTALRTATTSTGTYTVSSFASTSDDWAMVGLEVKEATGPSCDALTVVTGDPAGQLWFNETVESDGLPYTTQVNVSASAQTGATPALSVTNDGGIACDVTIRLMSDPGTGRSLKFNTTNSAPWPADASREVPLDPSTVTVCSGVASGGTCDIWLWADYENALGGQAVVDVRVETL